MGSPAERYSAARRRAASPLSAAFRAGLPFELDPFQARGCQALEAGRGVLVAAPTGAGKTVVGEFAVALALSGGTKCFYTTPIKALSNQKYADLAARHGAARVGLLTGDNSRNGDAPVVVMTTEVLRNMLYAGSPALAGLSHVVMDEVHYLSDRFRGAVWEEVIIHLPRPVTLVSLSATVSNAEEFGEWLAAVRGETEVVVEEHRPVPLWQHVLAAHRLHDLFADDAGETVNPALLRLARDEARFAPRHRRRRGPLPDRVEVLERLDRDGLLPAIVFVFSRAGCDAAAASCLRSGLRLTTPDERDEIRAYATARCAAIPEEDLGVLGYADWLAGLERGVAAHHAGLLPTFKETTEELFARGLVKAVFATETLALGINMPARSVVLERLTKWNGETHADVTPGEYTQLTGRAGRRGIDVEGHAVVLWTPDLDPAHLAGLASRRTYPLRSSFRPSYNMAVNLVGSLGRERARQLLARSFAQFQADRAVAGLTRQVRRNEEALAGYAEAMRCDRGDFLGYLRARRRLRDAEARQARTSAAARQAATADALAALRPGDVVALPAGRRVGPAVVVAVGAAGPVVVSAERQLRRLTVPELVAPPVRLGRLALPKGLRPRSPQDRRDLVASLRAKGFLDRGAVPVTGEEAAPGGPAAPAGDEVLDRLRSAVTGHPCHSCPDRDDHLRWAGRHEALAHETDGLRTRVSGRSGSLARTFDRVCAVLDELGYLRGEETTADGARLARIYAESDLLVAECLRQRLWAGLDPAGLAAAVSALVYESRSGEESAPLPPPPAVRAVLDRTRDVWANLHELEAEHRLDTLRPPDPGFAWAVHRWASGQPLERVLDGELTAGDFVRWCRQVIDLLDQLGSLSGLADPAAAAGARRARDLLVRGVVATAGALIDPAEAAEPA